MKRLSAVFLFAALVATPSAFALTTTVTLTGGNGYGQYQTGQGGEFTFAISDPTLISSYGSGVNVGGAGTFQTFCVEGPEYIYPYGQYTANFNSANQTMYGGVTLTRGAAWLYSQFASGHLAGYDYANRTTAGALQNAIWAFMGQEGLSIDPNHLTSFEAAAFTGLQLLGMSATANANLGDFGVYVLNLWNDSDPNHVIPAQDQLIYSPLVTPNSVGVPDGGTTAMLLGIAFTGTAFISRKIRRF